MLFSAVDSGVALLSAGQVAAAPATEQAFANAVVTPTEAFSIQACYDTETAALQCYTAPDNTPQDVDPADITFAAAYLRAYGRQTRAGRLFTMNADAGSDCEEWVVYAHNSVSINAKHLNTNANTSVLFEDIASTIDGGVSTTVNPTNLFSCGSDGGALGVQVNTTNTAYTSAAYQALNATPDGILIKVVWSGA